jgi:hypothetical protein
MLTQQKKEHEREQKRKQKEQEMNSEMEKLRMINAELMKQLEAKQETKPDTPRV